MLARLDPHEDYQQVSAQHHPHVQQGSLLLRAGADGRARLVLCIQLADFFLSFAKVSVELSLQVLCSRFVLLSLSFLVSGNLENNAMMKPLEELNYFDGDASAVSAGLVHNVDVSDLSMVDLSFTSFPVDLLPRTQRFAFESPSHRQ